MTPTLGKFSFIHKRLWQQDGTYRIALLLGPAVLVGATVAAGLWGAVLAAHHLMDQPPQWATMPAPVTVADDASHPITVQPSKPLPKIGTDGAIAEYDLGWEVAVKPIEVSPTMVVDIKPNPLAGFTVTGPGIDMEQILAGGPKQGLYVGTGTGLLVAREPGIYALSVRFERPPGPIADCLTRLGFGQHRILSHLNLNLVAKVATDFETTWFDLQPGLYPVGWAFGCWHGQQMTGPGRINILISHPGETKLLPARPGDFVR